MFNFLKRKKNRTPLFGKRINRNQPVNVHYFVFDNERFVKEVKLNLPKGSYQLLLRSFDGEKLLDSVLVNNIEGYNEDTLTHYTLPYPRKKFEIIAIPVNIVMGTGVTVLDDATYLNAETQTSINQNPVQSNSITASITSKGDVKVTL